MQLASPDERARVLMVKLQLNARWTINYSSRVIDYSRGIGFMPLHMS